MAGVDQSRASPTLSVALCTHNGAAYVEEQVRSILNQSRLPTEVVVSDDASTDGTVGIVRRVWAQHAPAAVQLRIITNSVALGVSKNFEQAVSACAGDVIALSDQDDVWAPRRVEVMIAEFARRPELSLLFTDARLVDASGDPLTVSLFQALEISEAELQTVTRGTGFDTLLRRNLATGATMMFRRSLLQQALPFPEAWVHDEWLAIIASVVSTVGWLPERLIDYRQHGANQIGVAVPTLAYKVRRVTEPRGTRPAWLVQRATELLARVIELSAQPTVVQKVRAKLAHDQMRAGLPATRVRRIVSVLREARAGRYLAYSSQGNRDILRDLLQPVR